eukprot:2073511-Prorocentrum_lima.AAC.1
MTSSLVGSEMCIRDRHSFQSLVIEGGPFSLALYCLRTTIVTVVLCGDTPVSYTHLTLPTICSV